MHELNLKKKDEAREKTILSLYKSDIQTLKTLSEATGVSLQNLIRHAINNMLDTEIKV